MENKIKWQIFLLGISLFSIETTMYIILQETVKTNIVFATAIATTGYAIGDFFWPLMYKLLLDEYTWRGAFLIHGALLFNHTVLVLILTSELAKPEHESTKYYLDEKVSNGSTFFNTSHSSHVCQKTYWHGGKYIETCHLWSLFWTATVLDSQPAL